MEEWKNIRKKYKRMEVIGIIFIIIFIVIGVLLDWNVIVNKNIIVEIGDIESFSLTILQIQATVGTLIVAIIALITGNISDSYMGISVSDFYLNIKPWKLKQKMLIFISLGLCLAGVIFHSLHLYNSVFYLFLATLIVISISIIEIYSAFNGRNIQCLEIEAYINYLLERNIEFEEKLNIYQNFVIDWKKEIELQDKQTYEKYVEIFKKFMTSMWTYHIDEGLVVIQQQCYNVSCCLLGSDKIIIKERGIEFVQYIYEILWGIIYEEAILNKKPLLNKYKSNFTFFSEIGREFIENIEELNVEKMEKKIRFGNFTDLVQRITIWLKYDVNTSHPRDYEKSNVEYEGEISELSSLARYMGYYLYRQKKKGNIVTEAVWISILSSWSIFSSYNIPEERCERFLKDKVEVYFNYCYGMLVSGQENIIKQGIYLAGMGRTVRLDNKYQASWYLSVHCYVYYLAECESDNCITENIRKTAKNILEDVEVRNAFFDFLDMLVENEEWLDSDMSEKIHRLLDRYEMFPKYEPVKTIILRDVISDFYLFIILFISYKYYMPELLEKNIDDMSELKYVSEGKEQETKVLLKTLYKIISIENKSEKQIDVEVGLMYDNLEKVVKKKQKERHIKLAKEAQYNYENNINLEEICERIKTDTIERIKEKFSTILVDGDNKNGIIRVGLLSLTEYTKSFEKKKMDGYYSHIDGMFLLGIMRFLFHRKVVNLKNRFEDFLDDKDFMEYLKENELNILLGSQYVLRNKDFRVSSEFNKFLESYETIYTSVVSDGMALKNDAVRICLHDVNVSIHSPCIRETSAKYDNKTGKFNYSIIGGVPIDFEENELREFLYNNRKVINVTAKISIEVKEKPVGTIFTSGKKRQ